MSRASRNKVSWVALTAAALLTLFIGWNAYQQTIQDQNINDAMTALLESSEHGKAIMDENGRIIFWNPALERMSGYSDAEVKRHGLQLLMGPELFQKHRDAYRKAMVGRLGQVRIIHCDIPAPHADPPKPPVPVRITVRITESRHGDRYAIAQVDRESRIKETAFHTQENGELHGEDKAIR